VLIYYSWVYQGETSQTYSEIDILENVNLQTANTHSLYTSEQCTINVVKGDLSPEKTTNCHWTADGPSSQGCSFNAEEGTFNQPFNNQYKVIVLQVEAERIRIWHFKKNEVPADLNSAHPNPDAWTKAPTMHITPKNCDFNKAFRMFHIVSEYAYSTPKSLLGCRAPCISVILTNLRLLTSLSAANGPVPTSSQITLANVSGKRVTLNAINGWAIIRAISKTLTSSSTLSSCSKELRDMKSCQFAQGRKDGQLFKMVPRCSLCAAIRSTKYGLAQENLLR
jgi:hypothetical protein